MRRFRFSIPLSILIPIVLTLVGTWYVRGLVLQGHMRAAMTADDLPTVRSLLHKWPAPWKAKSDRRENLLLWACRMQAKDVALAALDHGSEVNVAGARVLDSGKWTHLPGAPVKSPLMLACEWDDADVVRALLAHGADPKVVDESNWTPLHALGAGHADIAEEFIRRGAEVNAKGLLDTTPLHEAASFDRADIAKVLLDHGADLKARCGESQMSPMHLASAAGSVETLKLLISRGADIEATDGRNRTPLHEAAANLEAGAIEVLLAAGAKVNAEVVWGSETPLALARECAAEDRQAHPPIHRKGDAIAILLKAGAK